MTSHIVDIGRENAQHYLIDESHRRPVLVDFWADWCAPCKVLLPVLEKLAADYGGAFLVAKVNADEHQEITAQFGIRSLPTLVVMVAGQPADAIQGAQPESVLRQLLEKYLPDPWDRVLDQAREQIRAGDCRAALPALRRAHRESEGRSDIALALAHVLLQLNRPDEAEEVLQAVPASDRDTMYQQLLTQLDIKRQAAKPPVVAALEARLTDNPKDLDAAWQLVDHYAGAGHVRDALEALITVLAGDRDFREGEARKRFLEVLGELDKGDPLAVEFQRRFYNLMY